jgi:hypothetical protein
MQRLLRVSEHSILAAAQASLICLQAIAIESQVSKTATGTTKSLAIVWRLHWLVNWHVALIVPLHSQQKSIDSIVGPITRLYSNCLKAENLPPEASGYRDWLVAQTPTPTSRICSESLIFQVFPRFGAFRSGADSPGSRLRLWIQKRPIDLKALDLRESSQAWMTTIQDH